MPTGKQQGLSVDIHSDYRQCRSPVLHKTDRTFIPKDRRYIERFLNDAAAIAFTEESISRKKVEGKKANKLPPSAGKKGKKGKDKKGRQDKSSSGMPSHGQVVGSNVAPISETNVGHRMLAAMG